MIFPPILPPGLLQIQDKKTRDQFLNMSNERFAVD